MKLHRKVMIVAVALLSISVFSGCSKSEDASPAAQAAARTKAISGYAPSAAEQARANALVASQDAAAAKAAQQNTSKAPGQP